MNSGQQELTIENKITEYENKLSEIIEKIGISYTKDQVSIETLNLTYSQLKEMDQQECCILAYKLQQYSLYIQSLYNRLENIKNWAEQSLIKIIGKYSQQYGTAYTKYEEKKGYIISENTAAQALMKIILNSGGKSQELNSISSKISHMANILIEISKSKRITNG